jgi:hypothetical protein
MVDPEKLAGRLSPETTRLVEIASMDELVGAVEKELARLRTAGVDANDIAVVSLAGRSASRLLGSNELADAGLVRADHEDAPKKTVLDTFLRFKGLERPVILIAEPGHEVTHWRYDVRFHVALTRATAAVVIVATSEAIDKDARLKVLRGIAG